MIKRGGAWIPLTGLTPPHFCYCPKPGPAFSTLPVKMRGDCFVDIGDLMTISVYEEFEDTKGAIIIRISKNRQHNGQKKKYKRTNNDQQNIHIKL